MVFSSQEDFHPATTAMQTIVIHAQNNQARLYSPTILTSFSLLYEFILALESYILKF